MTKTNIELVNYCKAQLGRPYWFGTFGQIATTKLLTSKAAQYPSYFSAERQAKAKLNHIGQKVHDCYGLVKGYFMSDGPDAGAVYKVQFDISADEAFNRAAEKGTIDTLPDIVGLGLWRKGHFGVYIGNGREIEARGFDYGVVERDAKTSGFTHWVKISGIDYVDAPKPQIEPVKPPSTSDDKIHIVKKGETLSAISKRYGVSIDELMNANKFIKNPNKIYIGDKLTIPTKTEQVYHGEVKTNGGVLNIRAGKGTNYKIIGTLPNGAGVTLSNVSGEWFKLADRDGYVCGRYIVF